MILIKKFINVMEATIQLMRNLNNLEGQGKLIEDCQWYYARGVFQQGSPKLVDMRVVGKAFYTSSYICPKCSGFMLKANAGEFVGVRTSNGTHSLKSVFACDKCKILYSAVPGKKLSQGDCYVMDDKSKFQNVVDTINMYGISAVKLSRFRVVDRILADQGIIYNEASPHSFNSFFNDSTDTEVFNYIQSKSRTELIRTIQSEYYRIKSRCIYTPAMGRIGSLEFAGALLIWKYCRENMNRNLSIYAQLMNLLGIIIGCAYNCVPPTEWSNKIDMVINNNDLLDYTEWNQIYNYLKEGYIDEIQGLEFNVGNLSEQQRDIIYTNFIVKYNSMSDYGSVFEYYQRQGLRLREDMP